MTDDMTGGHSHRHLAVGRVHGVLGLVAPSPMTSMQSRLVSPDGGYYYCSTCGFIDRWLPELDAEGRFPVAYACACGKARIPADKVQRRIMANPDVAAVFEEIGCAFESHIQTLRYIQTSDAVRQASELRAWMDETP